mgnify:CR=1 FL=1
MQALREALAQVGQSGSAIVALSAPPGVGKTRLAEEFLREARRQGCQVLRGECEAETDGREGLSDIGGERLVDTLGPPPGRGAGELVPGKRRDELAPPDDGEAAFDAGSTSVMQFTLQRPA